VASLIENAPHVGLAFGERWFLDTPRSLRLPEMLPPRKMRLLGGRKCQRLGTDLGNDLLVLSLRLDQAPLPSAHRILVSAEQTG